MQKERGQEKGKIENEKGGQREEEEGDNVTRKKERKKKERNEEKGEGQPDQSRQVNILAMPTT